MTGRVDRRRGPAALALAAVLALAVAWLLGYASPRRALLGYLSAWLFGLGLSLGSLALLAVHVLTGGRWGTALRATWTRAAALLPVVGVLWLPLLLGASRLFPWAMPGDRETVPRWYLDLPFLYARAVACFAIWCVMAWRLRRLAAAMLARRPTLGEQGLAGAALLALLLTTTVTAVDWVMSLVPSWHSTALGLLLLTSFLTAALALAVARWSAAAPARAATDAAGLQLRRDLGNLMLAAALGWGYLAFMDYLTAWIADLPAETVWYLPRMRWPWLALPPTMLALHLALPLALLLPRRGKQHLRVLQVVAWSLLAMQGLNMVWLVWPGLRDAAHPLAWSDGFAIGGVALAMGAGWRTMAMGEEVPG